MTACYITLWSDNGPRWCWDQPIVRNLFESARPPGVQIHTTPARLVREGASLTRTIRDAFPSIDAWWAITGDSDGPDPTRVWIDAAKAALDANVQNLVLNCERAWKRRPAGLARRALAALHNAVPLITLGHTAYDAPVRALWQANPPLYFGGQSPYPTREFLGADSPVKWTIPQIYWATRMTPSASRGPGIRRLAKHRASFALAKRQGVIRADMRVDAYLQTYGCRTDELCFVATQFESASWWVAKPGHLRDAGATAIRVLCELDRRGFRGPDAIVQAQRTLGVEPDGWVGKSTLEALFGRAL